VGAGRSFIPTERFTLAHGLNGTHRPSQIFGNQFELLKGATRRALGLQWPFQTIADVIMDQGFLGTLDRALDGLQLLSDFQTWSVFFDHFDDGLKVTVGTLETSDDGGVILVGHVFSCPPVGLIYPPWRIKKSGFASNV
jgi:hypothetical protein